MRPSISIRGSVRPWRVFSRSRLREKMVGNDLFTQNCIFILKNEYLTNWLFKNEVFQKSYLVCPVCLKWRQIFWRTGPWSIHANRGIKSCDTRKEILHGNQKLGWWTALSRFKLAKLFHFAVFLSVRRSVGLSVLPSVRPSGILHFQSWFFYLALIFPPFPVYFPFFSFPPVFFSFFFSTRHLQRPTQSWKKNLWNCGSIIVIMKSKQQKAEQSFACYFLLFSFFFFLHFPHFIFFLKNENFSELIWLFST